MKKKLVLIDGKNRVYGSEWGKGLYYKGQRTSGILTFLTTLRTYAGKYKAENIIVCWDSYSKKRRELYKDYKKGRPKDKIYKEILSEIEILEKMLDSLGIKQYRVEGYEADDLIGDIAKTSTYDKIIISNDSDMWQLLGDDVTIKHGNKVMTEELLKQNTGLTPDEFLLRKIIVGDVSDNIRGIEKIGEKTFQKILDDSGSMDSFLDHPKIQKHTELIQRNYELIALEKLGLKETEKVLNEDRKVDFASFRSQCFKLRLFSIVKRFQTWIAPFGLEKKEEK